MTALPPPRELPRHAERRDQLLSTITRSSPYAGGRARWLIPVGVAAAVAAVAAGIVLLLGDLTDRAPAPPAASSVPPASGAPEPTAGSPTQSPSAATPDAVLDPSWSHHVMSASERSQAFNECTTGAAVDWRSVFEPVVGYVFELDASAPLSTVRKWLVARSPASPSDQLVCEFDGHGFSGGHRFGSSIAKDNEYMLEPVEAEATGFGRYTDPVVTVTVSRDPAVSVEVGWNTSAAEVRAKLVGGYWFAPAGPEAVWRGYDADGNLVFDSSVGPPYEGCYADPSGERVVELNTASPGVDPAECRRTYEWP